MSDTDKTLAIVMVAIILLSLFPVAGYLTILVLLSHYIRRNRYDKIFATIKKDPALLFLLTTFGLSALMSEHRLASLAGLGVFALQVTFYVIIRSTIKDRSQNLNIIKYLLMTSLIVSVLGILQYYFVAHTSPNWLDQHLYKNIPNRAFSTLYNPNVLGSYLILVISVAVAGFSCYENKHSKLISSLIFVAACLCMMLTFSRGAWLGLAVSIAIIFAFSKEKRYIVSMIGLTVLLAIPELDKILSRINLDFLSNDSSNVYRRYLWKMAVKTFEENPMLGAGVGSFGFSLPSSTKAAGYLVSHAHNIYLHILAETGLLGFFAFFGYIILAIYVAFKLYMHSRCKQTRALALGMIGSSAGLLVHGTVDATLYLPQLSIFVWIMIASIRNLGDLEAVPTPAFSTVRFGIKPVFSRIILVIKPVLSRMFLNIK